MWKTYVLGVGLLVIAISAVAGASASAAEFLLNGAKGTGEPPATVTGEMTMDDLDAPGGDVGITCSIEILGTWMFFIWLLNREIMTLAGATGNMVTCTFTKKGVCEGTTATALAIHLPWLTELLEPSSGVWRLDLLEDESKPGLPGWEVECKTILGSIKDTCTGETSMLAENMTEGLLGIFDAESAKVNCSLGGEGAGDLGSPGGVGLLMSSSEGTISAS